MPDQLDIETFIASASRRADPDTSKMAAERVAPHASHGRILVLENLAVKPLTDFELSALTGWLATSIGKRRGECVKNGWVENALDGHAEEVRRPSPSGSPALVWQITQAGRDVLAEHQRKAA